jgi:hypothetical protein
MKVNKTSTEILNSHHNISIWDIGLVAPYGIWSYFIKYKLTFVANLNEFNVSEKFSSRGETFTNMRVLLLPPNEFCNRYVNLLFL